MGEPLEGSRQGPGAEADESAVCPHCLAPNPPAAVVCAMCGGSIAGTPGVAIWGRARGERWTLGEPSGRSNGLPILAILAGILFVVLLTLWAVLFLGRVDDEVKARIVLAGGLVHLSLGAVLVALANRAGRRRSAGRSPAEHEAVPPPPPPPPPEELIARLRSDDPAECRRAWQALVDLGTAAVPALEAVLADADPDVRVDVERALRAIRGEPVLP